jgi:hypothetical protein
MKAYRFILVNDMGELIMSTEVDAPDPTIDLELWGAFLSGEGSLQYLGEFEEEDENNTSGLNLPYRKKMELAKYIAQYIQEEVSRGAGPDEISTWLISEAIDAFEGGAADEEDEA